MNKNMNLLEIMVNTFPFGWGLGILLAPFMLPKLYDVCPFPIILFYIFGVVYIGIGILMWIFHPIKIGEKYN